MQNKIRLAVIGLGWVGTHRHLPFLTRNPQVEVCGVVDRNHAKVARAQKKFRVPLGATVTGAGQISAEIAWLDQIDAVTIATPPATHFAIAQQMLLAGKHVLLEKPMAMHPAEGETLISIAKRQNVSLAVVHNFQFARALLKLKRQFKDSTLGELRSIEATQFSSPDRRLPSWYETLPLGLFYDESPHLLYLINALAPSPPQLENVHIVPSQHGRRTPAMVSAHYQSGSVPIRLSMNFEAPISEWQLIVVCSKAVAVVDIFRDILIVIPHDGQHTASAIVRTSIAGTFGHWRGTLQSGLRMLTGRSSYGNERLQQIFVMHLQDGSPLSGISADDGLKILKMQHALLAHA